MAKELLISEFKAHCIAELKKVAQTGRPLIVTLRGKPLVRVEPAERSGSFSVHLGTRPGRAVIKRDLVRVDFSKEWEMNR